MQGVIGHDWAVQRLQQAIEREQLAQSHLFVGPPSVGKATLALATAQKVLSQGARDPQRAMNLVAQRKHPDLTWIASDGSAIKVDVVRELLHTLSLAPVESKHRVAVVDDAHTMSDSGKNAILKTLEEPNQAVIMILIAPSVDMVLPTISSRCQVLNLRPVPVQAVIQALLARKIAPDKAEFVARLSRGRVGWALRAVEDDDVLETRERQLKDLQTIVSADRTQRFAYAEKLAKEEPAIVQNTLLEWLLLWRDVVRRVENRANAGKVRNVDFLTFIDALADALPLVAAHESMQAIQQTVRYLSQSVNARLALDVLLLKIPQITSNV